MAHPDLNKTNTTIGGQSLLSRISSFRHSSRINIIVQLLDDTEQISLQLKSSSTGQAVLDAVCQEMNIYEREFFGLRYQDNNRFRYWIDLTKPINRQLKGEFVFLSLRFRFYPLNPALLKEDITRYQLFVQLRRDLLHGRLYCTQNDAIELAGLILQAVLGDHDDIRHPPGYVSEYKLILKQTERLEEKIAEYHKQLRGMTSTAAETNFISRAASIDTYGFDPYVVKDSKQSQDLVIGATCRGILVFSKNQMLKNIPWKHLSKIDYAGKELKVYPTKDFLENEHLANSGNILDVTSSTTNSNGNIPKNSQTSKKPQFKFICPTSIFAKHLWRHILSQQVFFTENEARLVKPIFSRPRIPLFSRGSTFRCPTKKVLHEIEQNPAPAREDQPITFARYPLPKQVARSDISAPTSLTGTLKSVRTPKIVEESVSPGVSVSENSPVLQHSESSETLTSPLLPAATSTPLSSSPVGPFTPPKEVNSIFNTTLESQISTTSVQTTSDEDLAYRNNPEIYRTSMEEEKPIEQILKENYDEAFPPLPSQSVATSEAVGNQNGHLNGAAKNGRKDPGVMKKQDNIVKKAMRTVLTIFMFLLIITSFAVLIFEANDGKGARWTREIQPISSFRQIIYDPSKDVVQQLFRKFH